jgi:nondiscriminating glutamyl-tRNA synthetase
MPWAELVERFDVGQLSARDVAFDPERLRQTSRHFLRAAPAERVGCWLKPRLQAAFGQWNRSGGTAHQAQAWYRLLVSALQAEAATLQEMVALSTFCFVERVELDPKAREVLAGEQVPAVLHRFLATLNAEALRTPDLANQYLRELRHHFRDKEGWRGRLVMFPLRATLTGTMVGPCLGNVTSLLGLQRCIARTEAQLG